MNPAPAVAVVTGAVLLWGAPALTPAYGKFTRGTTAALGASSGTLLPPASVTPGTCTNSGSTASLTVNWPATTSKVKSYTIVATPSGGGTTVTNSATGTPPATSTTFSATLAKGKSYTITVTTIYLNWTSASRAAASAAAC